MRELEARLRRRTATATAAARAKRLEARARERPRLERQVRYIAEGKSQRAITAELRGYGWRVSRNTVAEILAGSAPHGSGPPPPSIPGMSDPDDVSKSLIEAASPLDDMIMARLIDRVLEKAQAEGVDPHDAIKAAMPFLEKCAGAGRVAAEHLAKASSPAALIRRARANQAAVAREKERRDAWGRKLAERQDHRAAGEAVGKAESGLAKAQVQLDLLQKTQAGDRDVVLAEGSVAMWTDRLDRARANLAALEKSAKGTP